MFGHSWGCIEGTWGHFLGTILGRIGGYLAPPWGSIVEHMSSMTGTHTHMFASIAVARDCSLW